MKKFENEIKKALQREIIRRYYYRSGLIESSFAQDEVVLKATSILKDPKTYKSTLGQ